MLNRLTTLEAKLWEAALNQSGEFRKFFEDRARTIGNFIEDIQRGWAVDEKYINDVCDDFERIV